MSSPYLSKSRFKLASECPRKLYYGQHRDVYPDKKVHDPFLQALAEGGHQVGALAQCYHPGGVPVHTLDPDQALTETDALLQRDQVTIFEAAIRHENFFLRVDVLEKNGDKVDLIEVKAKSYDPGEDDFRQKRSSQYVMRSWLPYLDDTAFQTWVTRQAYPQWDVRPWLMLVDKTRVADVEGLHQLFRLHRRDKRVEVELTEPTNAERLGREVLRLVDVSDEVEGLITGTAIDPAADPMNARPIAERANEYARILHADQPCAVEIGAKCKKCEFRIDPQTLTADQCSGFHQCWSEQLGHRYRPEEPLALDIWNQRKADRWLQDGIHRMADVPDADLNDRQELQVAVTLGRRPGPEVISPGLRTELATWVYPLHFLDFETIMPAIPFHAGMRPYQNLAFQFSCHHLHQDGTITHDEWLCTEPGVFPSLDFLVALRQSLGDHGTVLRYSPHEQTILKHLSEQLAAKQRPTPDDLDVADYRAWIDTLLTGGDRGMADMWDAVKRHYYHAHMGGSNSIKDVLPSVLMSSTYLEERYSRPLDFGTNLTGMVLHQRDPKSGHVADPYKLLPPVFDDVDPTELAFLDQDAQLNEGGIAMTAWARMQFCEMGTSERQAIEQGLLRYCELDTLAMLMIYQHWRSTQHHS